MQEVIIGPAHVTSVLQHKAVVHPKNNLLSLVTAKPVLFSFLSETQKEMLSRMDKQLLTVDGGF